MNAFLQTLRNLGPLRLAAIALVTFSLLGFFGFITTRITSSPLALLYSDLNSQDSGAIVQKLDGMKIPYEVDSTGSLIRVPSDQVGKIRMQMAAQDLPRGGSIGYEIFDQKEGFGTTSFVQNINHLRALEGELARTIGALDSIQSARVHLVLPQRELFSHNTQTATASIFVKTRNGAVLTHEQIAAIQHLIAAAVPELQPNQVSIVDNNGNLLARPSAGGVGGPMGGDGDTADDVRAAYETAQARKIEDLLAQTLGYGKVRAQVSADFDFDRVTTNSEIYDPDSQVIRSTQTNSENSTNSEGSTNPPNVSVANALPANPAAVSSSLSGGGSNSNNKNNHSEETVNYEINKTIRSQTREGGHVKRLSVAVVVDGTYEPAADKKGPEVYRPRSDDEMAKIKNLVASAVNLDATRGDTIDVQNMPFAQSLDGKEQGSSPDLLMGVPRADLFHAVETLVLAIIGLLVVLLVVRPILRRVLDTSGVASAQQNILSGGGGSLGFGGSPAQLAGPGSMGGDVGASESDIDRMIDVSRVDGQVKASSLRKVGEIVDKHPEEAVSILRNWIYQESR